MSDPIQLARAKLASRDIHAAADILRQSVSNAPLDLKRRAAQLIVAEEIYEAYDLAAKCWTDYFAAPNPDPADLAPYAHVLWVNGQSDQSIDAYRRAVAARPNDANLLASLGMVLLSAGKHLDAYLSYGAACGMKADMGNAILGRACAFRLLTGDNIVPVDFAGETLRFALTGKAVEVDFAHLQGTLSEPTELSHLSQLKGQLDTIVDIGANVGNHACFFAKVLRPRRLIAFEVNPRCVEALKKNLSLNAPEGTQTEIRCTAVGKEPGHLVLPIHDDLNTGLVSEGQGERVEVKPLDDLIDHCQFLKIDVEGMELDVLAGASRILARSRPVLFVEVHRQNQSAFESLMKQLNYQIVSTYPYHAHTNYLATAAENQSR
jgi:FkbM family methyltransferase